MTIEGYCSTDNDANWKIEESADCAYTVKYTTKQACPKTYNLEKYFNVIEKYLGAIFIVIGGIMVFFGARFIEIVFAGLVGLLVSALSFILAYNQFLNQFTATKGAIIGMLVGCFLLGAIGSYFAFRFANKWAIPVIAAWGGVAVFLPLSKLVGLHGTWVPIVFAILGAGTGFYLGLKSEFYVKRIGTSMIGAFLFTRGLGSIVGGYPSESKFASDAANGKFHYNTAILGYVACMIVLTIAGSVFQIRHYRQNQGDDGFSGEEEENQGKCC